MLNSYLANNRYSPLPRAEIQAARATATNTARDDREWVSPVPVDAPLPKSRHGELGEASARWVYRSPTGHVLHYVCRFDPPGRKKEFRALSLAQAERPLSLGVACAAGATRSLQSRQDSQESDALVFVMRWYNSLMLTSPLTLPMAAHKSQRTTKLYDRTKERLTQDDVERNRL
jgi:hypothetical protein